VCVCVCVCDEGSCWYLWACLPCNIWTNSIFTKSSVNDMQMEQSVIIFEKHISSMKNTVTCGLTAREHVDKHVSMEVDSWRLTRYRTHFRVTNIQQTFPRIPQCYISSWSAKNQVPLQRLSQNSWSKMITRIHRRKLIKIGHDLLYWAWTDRGLIYIVYTFR
jgi:hypothetical protein